MTNRLILNLKQIMKSTSPDGQTTHSVASMIPGVAFAVNPVLGNIGATLTEIGTFDDDDSEEDRDSVEEQFELQVRGGLLFCVSPRIDIL